MLMGKGPRSRGFTLAEVTIAALLVAVGLVALMAAFYSGLQLVESGRNMAQASADARAVFEEMRRLSGTGLGPVVTRNWSAWSSQAGLTALPGEQVSVSFGDPAADPVEATVTVTWTERTRSRSASFTGLITRR